MLRKYGCHSALYTCRPENKNFICDLSIDIPGHERIVFTSEALTTKKAAQKCAAQLAHGSVFTTLLTAMDNSHTSIIPASQDPKGRLEYVLMKKYKICTAKDIVNYKCTGSMQLGFECSLTIIPPEHSQECPRIYTSERLKRKKLAEKSAAAVALIEEEISPIARKSSGAVGVQQGLAS